MRIKGWMQGSSAPVLVMAFYALLFLPGSRTASSHRVFQQAGNERNEIQIPPPPFSDGIFPCSECHAEMETNPERRELEDFHDDIVLKHDEENRWCMDCHDADNRDMLHTASGELIDFK